MHNVVTSKAIGYWRNPNLTRAWNSWTTLVLARERHLKADFAQKCLQPTSRAHLGLVLRMWFNVQGLKAFNTWKALYILQSDLRKDKQKAVATLGAGLTMEEELRAAVATLARRTGSAHHSTLGSASAAQRGKDKLTFQTRLRARR